MKISMGKHSYDFKDKQESPEEASASLRKSINSRYMHHLNGLGWAVWKAAMLLIKAFAWFVFTGVIIYIIFHKANLFVISFLAGTGIFVLVFAMDLRRRFWKKVENGSILIGKAFPHLVEVYGTTTPIKVGSRGNHYINYLKEPNPHVLCIVLN